MTWTPTGKIRYRKGLAFGRRKLILQLEETRKGLPPGAGGYHPEHRWRDATTEDLPIRENPNAHHQ